MMRLPMLLAAAALLLLSAAGPAWAGNARVGAGLDTASDLIGAKVENAQGDDLGSVADVLVDPASGKVHYVVVSRGSVLGVGGKLYPVPWQALRYGEDNDRFVFDLTKDKLESAPNFGRDNWPDLASADWRQRIHSYYQQQGVLGRGMGGTQGSMGGAFDPNSIQTVSGRIASVSTSKAQPDMQQVTLATEDGKTVVVDLAPADVLKGRDFDLNVGDRLTVRGSKVSQAGRDRIVATELRQGDNQLQLRSNQGQPLWNGGRMHDQPGGMHHDMDRSRQRDASQDDARFIGYDKDADKDAGKYSDKNGQVHGQGMGGTVGDSDRPGQLVRVSKILSHDLQNAQGQRLADVDDLVVNTRTGQVEYAVIGRGGMAGIGETFHAVPWQAIDYNETKQALVLDTTKEKLDSSPSFTGDNWPDMSSSSWRSNVDRYYGVQSSGQFDRTQDMDRSQDMQRR